MAECCGLKWNRPQCVNMLNVIPDIYPKHLITSNLLQHASMLKWQSLDDHKLYLKHETKQNKSSV